MAYKVIRFHCNFCKRIFASKSYCEKQHEPICFMNPLRKSCGTCENSTEPNMYYEQKCSQGIDIGNKQKVECYRHKLNEE